jgi:hypothetical protein
MADRHFGYITKLEKRKPIEAELLTNYVSGREDGFLTLYT